MFYFGKRYSGGNEEELGEVKEPVTGSEFNELAKQFGGLMELKNQAEYQPDLKGKQAGDAVRRASRILSKVRQKLP